MVCMVWYGESEPLTKTIGAAKRQSGDQKFSQFSACKAHGNQHEIRITFLERDKQISKHMKIGASTITTAVTEVFIVPPDSVVSANPQISRQHETRTLSEHYIEDFVND